MKPSDVLRKAVDDELEIRGGGVRSLEAALGLKPWILRGLTDGARPQVPSVDRAAVIAAALGLQFYIGPPGARKPARFSGRVGRAEPPDRTPDADLAAVAAAVRDHWAALDGDYARRDWLERLRATSPALAERLASVSGRIGSGRKKRSKKVKKPLERRLGKGRVDALR